MSKQLSFAARGAVTSPSRIYLNNINSVLFKNSGNVDAIIDGNFLLRAGESFQAGLQSDNNFINQYVRIGFVGINYQTGQLAAPEPDPEDPEADAPEPASPRIDIIEFRLDECEATQRKPN